MPLYKSITVDHETHILMWEITESETDLRSLIKLESYSLQRLSDMKSELHRKAYLSVRHLLAIAEYSDKDLTYNENGKPELSDGVKISITHSGEYAAIILSSKAVGIDIERQRSKIELIANKFISVKEETYLLTVVDRIKFLTIIWGAKEAMFKLFGVKGVSFKKNMDVAPFELKAPQTKSSINFNDEVHFYEVYSFEFNGFTCVFVY